MNQILCLFLSVLIFNGCTTKTDEGWAELFNGKDLTDWQQFNDPRSESLVLPINDRRFEVIDGMIVGTQSNERRNSFLATKKKYSDFILVCDYMIEENVNSGIQIRSESRADYENGRVHGYQYEMETSERAWSGGIYDEGRRGWLYNLDLNPDARTAQKIDEWNHVRLECIGNSIRTWLNGVPVSHLIDDITPEGFIALQVHGTPGSKKGYEYEVGRQIKWKNIHIKTENLEPSPHDDIYIVNLIPDNLSIAEKQQGFELLFNAKPPVNPDKTDGDIITQKEYAFFELKFDFNFSEGASGGIIYGSGNSDPSIGLKYQIIDDKNHPDAKEGVAGNRSMGSLYDLIPAAKEGYWQYMFPRKGHGQWNQGRIAVQPDGKVEHWLNGHKVVEYTRGNTIFKSLVARSNYAGLKEFGMAEKGPIFFHVDKGIVHFRSIKIKEL